MSKKKINDPKYRRGKTFTQKQKPSNTVSNEKNTNYPFTFFEKAHTKCSLGSKFKNKPLIAVSGTKHTVTTDKNKILHRKLISNPIPFQATATPTKRISTRLTTTVSAHTAEKKHLNQKIQKAVRTGLGEKNNHATKEASSQVPTSRQGNQWTLI